jgi:hypothetical protein
MNNDYTKPSRIKRRLKRRWKKSKFMQERTGVLTAAFLQLMLPTLSQKTKVGPSLPDNIGQKAAIHAVFLRPHILKTGLIRLVSIMAGCIGLPLKRRAGSYAGSEIPIQSAAQRFSLVGGGYSTYIGVTA